MEREYMKKWASEILEIAYADWENEILLKKLLSELKYRSSNPGVSAREIIEKRLEELSSNKTAFKWPSTDAPAGVNGFSGDQYWYQEGLLSYVGYRVGKTHGISSKQRTAILDCVLFNQLPKVNSQSYMEEWGSPKTAARLKKMAEALASFVRNAKRKDSNSMRYAISDWECDLTYLFEKYYHEKLGFYWPETDL